MNDLMGKARLYAALGFAGLAVMVDFANWLMSLTADALLVGAALVLLWPLMKR